MLRIIVLFLVFLYAFINAEVIKEIKVIDNQRLSTDYIIDLSRIKLGKDYNKQQLSAVLKRLYDSDMFEDVNIKIKNGVALITVKENRIISEIKFKGDRDAKKDDDLKQNILSREKSLYSKAKAMADLEKLIAFYKASGYLNVKANVETEKRNHNSLDLVFDINQGKKTTISRIVFIGNSAFSDDDLKSSIASREHSWLSFIAQDADIYDKQRLLMDKQMILQKYRSNGFLQATVLSANAEILEKYKTFMLTFKIKEGKRFIINDLDFNANHPDVKIEDYKDLVDIEPGEYYNQRKILEIKERVNKTLVEKGFVFFTFVASPMTSNDPNSNSVSLKFDVQESPKVFVSKINVFGNKKTIDDVIRDKLLFSEGDPYNSIIIERSKMKLYSSAFFENVQISEEPTEYNDQVDINIKVQEMMTGSINFGAGYSSYDGFSIMGVYSDKNWKGSGDAVSLNANVSQRQQNVNFYYNEAKLETYDLSVMYRVFISETDWLDESSYQNRTAGASIGSGFAITENLSETFTYTWETVKIFDVQEDASSQIKREAGLRYVSELSHSITYDRRDNTLFPTEGYFLSLTTAAAGPGGTDYYLKNTFRTGIYFNLSSEKDVVLSFIGSVGYVFSLDSDPVSTMDMFLLGGTTLRGFSWSGVGPRDLSTGDYLGGTTMYRGSIQLDYSFKNMGSLAFHVFTDFGTLTGVHYYTEEDRENIADSGSIRVSVGFGVTWRSPMGTITLDWGFPVRKESYDETEIFYISAGARF